MDRHSLNLALSAHRWRARRAWALLAISAVVFAVMLSLVHRASNDLHAARTRLSTEVKSVTKPVDVVQPSLLAPPKFADDMKLVARLYAPLLADALTVIESAKVLNVKVTSIDANAEVGTIDIEIVSPSVEGVLAYVAALNKPSPKLQWTLLRTQAATSVTASIRGAARP